MWRTPFGLPNPLVTRPSGALAWTDRTRSLEWALEAGPPAGGSAQCPTRGCRLRQPTQSATPPRISRTTPAAPARAASDPVNAVPPPWREASRAGSTVKLVVVLTEIGEPGEVRPRSGRRIGKRRGRPRNRCARGESSGASRGKGADQSNHADAILNDAYPTHDTVTCVRHHEGIGHRVAGSTGGRRCVDRQREAGVDHLDLRRRRVADHRFVRRPRRDVRRSASRPKPCPRIVLVQVTDQLCPGSRRPG